MRHLLATLLIAVAPVALNVAQAQGTVYRCPNNVYTSEITDKEAKERGCRTIEGAPITIVSPPKRAPVQSGTGPSRPEGGKVDAKEQRARDSDARAILEAELKREEEALAALQKEFNNGEPERQGNERNYQRYLDRVEDMRGAIARKQADIAALRRELAKLSAAPTGATRPE